MSSDPKVTLSAVVQALRAAQAAPEIIQKAIEQLNKVVAEDKDDREANKKPKLKTQYVFLISDPEGKLDVKEHIGWVLQLEESCAPQAALGRIQAAAQAFNQSRAGRRKPLKTIGEAMESIKAKHLKTDVPGEKTLIKTKSPCYAFAIDGKLT